MVLKIVPCFPNADQVRCQQACIRSVLKYFLPEREYSEKEIDEGTAQTGGTTWFPPAVMFLDQAGLSVQLHSSKFDYEQFEIWGKEYIRENVTDAAFQAEEENKAFVNISAVQQATKRMLEKGLVKREDIDIPDLTRMLDSPATLAIGKTLMPWLSGIYANGPAHYVVIIKSYNPTLWRIHDPGPPSEAYRKVVKRIGGKPIFEEVLVIRGK